MTFQDAIISVIKDFGKNVLCKDSFLNILSDYNAFDESKSFKLIIKYFKSEGYLTEILSIDDWDLTSLKIKSRFIDSTGIEKDKVEYIFDSVAFALGLCETKAIYGQNSMAKVAYIECPFCKRRHNITATFCDNTGKRLRKACSNKSCSEYGKYILPHETKFCPMCGQSLHENSNCEDKGLINGYEYINLGLSVKWATCNIGASQPHEFGNYYAWGETYTKNSYTRENCISIGKKLGEISGLVSFDPARNQWGGSWRMPTKNELLELKNNCTWELTTLNGAKGMKVTGPNGNSIFLPVSGQYEGNTHQYVDYGYYSSGTAFKSRYSKEDEEVDQNWYLYFTKYGGQEVWGGFREVGYTVRPVTI